MNNGGFLELPGILEKLGLSLDKLSRISGIDQDKLLEVCNGSRVIMWNEFMSVLSQSDKTPSSKRSEGRGYNKLVSVGVTLKD